MINSKKQMVYATISSSILIVVILLFPSFNIINAQEENEEEEETSIHLPFYQILEFTRQVNSRNKCRKLCRCI